jgi:hypothetical protein
MLIIYMIKSGENLEYVVDCLMENKSIKGVHQDAQGTLNMRRRNSVSPMGRSSYVGGSGLSATRRTLTPTRSSRRPMF